MTPETKTSQIRILSANGWIMTAASDSEAFYAAVPVRRGFRSLMDAGRYTPLPDGWTIGIADVVASTKAIAEQRYKAVNMAGAAVIAALTNALGGREFPFVFGGDGASFAVPPGDAAAARAALAATAAWADGELGLTLRVALIPLAAIRRQGLDVRVARYGPSENLSYAMFAGGGLAWADAAVKRGEFAVTPAPPRQSWPDLTGLSCRFEEFRAARGLILAVLVMPAAGADPAAFRALTEDIVALVETSPEAGEPLPAGGPKLGWPPQGVALETHTLPGGGFRRARVLARTLLYFLVMRSGPARRRFRAGDLFAPGRREFRLPQIRRRAAHDHRLHAGARRHAGAAARGGGGNGELRPASAARRHDDLLHAVAGEERSRAFHRRRAGRLRRRGRGVEGRLGGALTPSQE